MGYKRWSHYIVVGMGAGGPWIIVRIERWGKAESFSFFICIFFVLNFVDANFLFSILNFRVVFFCFSLSCKCEVVKSSPSLWLLHCIAFCESGFHFTLALSLCRLVQIGYTMISTS